MLSLIADGPLGWRGGEAGIGALQGALLLATGHYGYLHQLVKTFNVKQLALLRHSDSCKQGPGREPGLGRIARNQYTSGWSNHLLFTRRLRPKSELDDVQDLDLSRKMRTETDFLCTKQDFKKSKASYPRQ